MGYRATRGVCIGVDRHLKPGDVVDDLDAASVNFLTSIGAIERFDGAAAPAAAPVVAPVVEAETETAPAKAGKKEK